MENLELKINLDEEIIQMVKRLNEIQDIQDNTEDSKVWSKYNREWLDLNRKLKNNIYGIVMYNIDKLKTV